MTTAQDGPTHPMERASTLATEPETNSPGKESPSTPLDQLQEAVREQAKELQSKNDTRATNAEKERDAAMGILGDLQALADQAELDEALKTSPEKAAAIKERQELRKKTDTVEFSGEDLARREAAVATKERSFAIVEAASEEGLDVQEFTKMVQELEATGLTLSNAAIALLAKRAPKNATIPATVPTPSAPAPKYDSGRGGTGIAADPESAKAKIRQGWDELDKGK